MLYIRTDANSQIGSGHVMRCLSIAMELRKQGCETTFITTEKDAVNFIKQFQFYFILIRGNWNNLESELDELVELIKENNADKLLVDSYYASSKYFEVLSQHAKLIYLGSLEKPFTAVKLLINYSNLYNNDFYANTYNIQKTRVLLGVQYAPLREEFQQIQQNVKDEVEDILLSSGNTDIYNVMQGIINYVINDDCFLNIRFHVVVGSMNRNNELLKQLEEKYDNVILYFDEKNMSKLMRNCDIAISAAGTTLYELCACGVPTVSFSITEEQIPGALKFKSDEIMYYAGDMIQDKEECFCKISNYSKALILSYSERREMASRMKNYIDGNGSKRIIEAIKEL